MKISVFFEFSGDIVVMSSSLRKTMGFFILLRVFVRVVIVFATQSKLDGAVLLPKEVNINKILSEPFEPENFSFRFCTGNYFIRVYDILFGECGVFATVSEILTEYFR